MSDLQYGQTGFRFVRIELLEGAPATVQNVFAVSTLPEFDTEASIRTDDEELNEILRTAAYTLKLNFQKGYIWDGIKRDRLVWCGDLNPEILTSLYLFGDTENIRKYCYEKFRHSLCHGWADRLVKTAKNAGCKYITLTTRHHDGFQGIPSVFA